MSDSPVSSQTPQVGRTVPDLFVHFVSSTRGLLTLLCSAALLVVIVVSAIWALAHNVAEPGAEVSVFWGAVKYPKGKFSQTPKSHAPTPKSRRMLVYVELSVDKKSDLYGWGTSDIGSPTPIFDGTVAVGGNSNSIYIRGLNVEKVEIGARNSYAISVEPRKRRTLSEGQSQTQEILVPKCEVGCVVELRYKDQLLRIELEVDRIVDEQKKRFTYYALIEPITQPTLELQSYALLKEF
jgi:hypothetical protein